MAAGYAATAVLLLAAIIQVLRSATDPANTSAPGYLPLAWVALAVTAAVLLASVVVRKVDIGVWRGLPFVIGALSLVASVVPWWTLFVGNESVGSAIYRGLRVPQGIVQFWDLVLPLQSIDCAAVGVDVYAANNGCLQDPTIYGPGVLWLQWVPFDVFSARNASVLGVVFIVVSSVFLAWLARRSTGIGQIVLLVAAVGAPWLLLLERGNLDATLLWGAAIVVVLAMRWNRLWSWSLAAAVIWMLGTWKYYPFAMGLMLLPVLRLRRGWVVLAGYAIAAVGFIAATWQTFAFSAQSNRNMIDYGDFVVLGRVPVVARMIGTEVGADGLQAGDLLVYALVLAAAIWGWSVARAWSRVPVSRSMLAVAGSSLFLASVLYAGFGWGYKAAFLLLAVPQVSLLVRARKAALASSAVAVLAFIAIDAVVVWNTVLATLGGLTAAGFSLGLSLGVLVRCLRSPAVSRPATDATVPAPPPA